jgi:hypothetical protein
MIGHSEWKANIIGVLERIADERYQRLAWFNNHPEVSSPDELINQLLGDFQFEKFVTLNECRLCGHAHDSISEFTNSLIIFCDSTPQFLNPFEIIDNPSWIKIRQAAAVVLRCLSET